MNALLSQTLRDAVDPGRPDVALDLADLAGRIRRRRAVRAGARAAVGVGAAGAVALGGAQVARHGVSRAPAAPAATAPSTGAASPSPASEGTAPAAECGRAATSLPTGPVTGWAVLGSASDADAALDALVERGEPVTPGVLGTYDQAQLSLLLLAPTDATAPGAPVRLLVVRGGTVVGAGRSSAVDPALWNEVRHVRGDVGAASGWSGTEVLVDLTGCDGRDLPAGGYEVYVGRDGTDGVTGPWTVDLLDSPQAGSVVLPSDFPADQVPMPSGTLASVAAAADGGWTVALHVVGDDGFSRATTLLHGVSRDGARVEPSDRFPGGAFRTRDGRWLVAVTASPSRGGDMLTYEVAPG